MRCSLWREAAENATESLAKGMRVIVSGRLVARSWDDKDTGQKRTVMEMQVDEVGPSLRYATAQVSRTQRGDNSGQPRPQQHRPETHGECDPPPREGIGVTVDEPRTEVEDECSA